MADIFTNISIKSLAKKRWETECELEPFINPENWGDSKADRHQPNEKIFIFQYGKVGSSSLNKYFGQLRSKAQVVAHVHRFSGGIEYLGHTLTPNKTIWLQEQEKRPYILSTTMDDGRKSKYKISPNETIWVVTATRNLFLRNLSAMFENHKTAGINTTTSMNEVFQHVHRWETTTEGVITSFFREHFFNVTSVNLEKYAFNVSRRALFVKSGNIRVLLLRYEDFIYWERIICYYFPRIKGSMPKTNLGSRAWYDEVYTQAQVYMAYSPHEVTNLLSSDTALFYTDCELAAWKNSALNPLPPKVLYNNNSVSNTTLFNWCLALQKTCCRC